MTIFVCPSISAAAYEERAGQRLCHVYAGGRRIATFEPQSTVCQALGLPAKWDGRLERLGRALTWPLRHGYQPAVLLALTLLGVLALVAGPAARRSVLRLGGASSREPWSPGAPRRGVGRAAPRAPWAWLASFLPTYRRPRRPSPYEAPLVLATARSWWQRAVAAVTMAALVMAQTPARAESPLPAGCFYYHLADHLGSSNVVTYRDGLVAQHFENGVFGREVYEQHGSTHQLSARYTGQIFDEETGLYYYGARYYDPELGRFTQADTLVPDPGDGQSLNRYSYANNNPLKYTDPSGHLPFLVAALAVVVGAGLVSGAISAGLAIASGGNIGQAFLSGFISGSLTVAGGLVGGGLGGAIAGAAIAGALNTAIAGGDGMAMLKNGLLAGGFTAISFGVGSYLKDFSPLVQNVGTIGTGMALGAGGSAISGGDPIQGMALGAAGAAAGLAASPLQARLNDWARDQAGWRTQQKAQQDISADEVEEARTSSQMPSLRAESRSVTPSHVRVNVVDPNATALAQRLGGVPSVKFPGLFNDREFDAVSELYLGQTKPGGMQLGSAFRGQAEATILAAKELGKTPYFHFNGPHRPGVIPKILEYGRRHGVDPVIDVKPFE